MRSTSYRMVKQGSVLVYLTFHIVTIFAVMLASVLRKSVVSILYVLILIPHMRTAAEVLTMQLFTKEKTRAELEDSRKKLEERHENANREISKAKSDEERKDFESERNQLKHELKQKQTKLQQIAAQNEAKSIDER